MLRKVSGGFGTSLRKQAGNALAAPFNLFSGLFGGFVSTLRPAEFDAEGNELAPVNKKFVGNQFFASLGTMQVRTQSEQGELGVQLQSKAGVWLDKLRAPAAAVHD